MILKLNLWLTKKCILLDFKIQKNMTSHQTTALNYAILFITQTFDVQGIIASGSIIRGGGNAKSDFDIFVIHRGDFRQRVQKYFDGIPCEIFVNTIEWAYMYFEDEKSTNRPVTAHMLASGRIMIGIEDTEILKLVEDAKVYAQTPCH
jgi:hypothetical protein